MWRGLCLACQAHTLRVKHAAAIRALSLVPRTAHGRPLHHLESSSQRYWVLDTLLCGAVLGLLMAVMVTAASVSDPAGARLLFARLGGACKKLRLLWVDGIYRGQLVEWVAQHMRFVLRPVLRPDGCKGFVLLPRRWVVERTLAWLNQSRRLSKDYERLPKSSEAMIYLSMTRLMLRRLVAT